MNAFRRDYGSDYIENGGGRVIEVAAK